MKCLLTHIQGVTEQVNQVDWEPDGAKDDHHGDQHQVHLPVTISSHRLFNSGPTNM